MQRWLFVMAVALAAAIGLEAWQQQPAKNPGHGWEYCAVQNWRAAWSGNPIPVGNKFSYAFTGEADICYEGADGCRIEKVIVTFSVIKNKNFYEDPEIAKGQRDAVAKALSELGARGWRLVGAGPDPSAGRPNQESTSTPVRSILYLERSKP